MKYYYSQKTNGLYIYSLSSSVMPDDAVELDENEYMRVAGKYIGPDSNGRPVVLEQPAPTQAELVDAAEREKAALLSLAVSEIEWRKYAVDKGVATDEESSALDEWQMYRVLLMRIDTSKPSDIEWPATPSE